MLIRSTRTVIPRSWLWLLLVVVAGGLGLWVGAARFGDSFLSPPPPSSSSPLSFSETVTPTIQTGLLLSRNLRVSPPIREASGVAPVPRPLESEAPRVAVLKPGRNQPIPATAKPTPTTTERATGEGAALHRLEERLAEFPRDEAARASLAEWYWQSNRRQEALESLEEGVQATGSVHLAKMAVFYRMQTGELEQADKVLRTVMARIGSIEGVIRQDRDGAAMLAALEQKRGRHREAAAWYGGLVRSDPERGIWWLGLAISLERIQPGVEAVNAYRRAMTSGRLEPSLVDFANKRVADLEEAGLQP